MSIARETILILNITSAWKSTRYVQYLVDTKALGWILNSYCLQNCKKLIMSLSFGVLMWVDDRGGYDNYLENSLQILNSFYALFTFGH